MSAALDKLQDILASVNLLVTDAIDSSPEVLPGALILTASLVSQTEGQLGVIFAADLRELFVHVLPDTARASFESTGLTTLEMSGRPLELSELSLDQLPGFIGAVLSLGADDKRLQALGEESRTNRLTVVVPRTESELAALEARFPGAGRLRRKVERREPSLSESQITRLNWFEERYEPVAEGHLNPSTDVVRLGQGEHQVCRYCGKTSPQVCFNSISHAFPEQIGNKSLIDLLECDSCNKRFARRLDDDFGKWSQAMRSLLRIRGKEDKVPKFGSLDDGVEFVSKNGRLTIKVREGDGRVVFDEEKKNILFEVGLQSYVPMAVFKCFVKMALSVMPEPEAAECTHLKKWVLEKTHTYESFPFRPLVLYTQAIGGPLPNDRLNYILFRRRPTVAGCPYMMFMVRVANFIYQIALPMPVQDQMLGSRQVTMKLSYFTHPWDNPEYEAKYGPARRLQEDLSSPELVRGEIYRTNFSYEELIDYTVAVQTAQDGKKTN